MADEEEKTPGIYIAVASCWKDRAVWAELDARFGPDERAAHGTTPPKAAAAKKARRFKWRVRSGQWFCPSWARLGAPGRSAAPPRGPAPA